MLGHKLVQTLGTDFEVFSTVRGEFSRYQRLGIFDRKRTFEKVGAEDEELIKKIVHQVKPDVLINGIGVIKQLPTSGDVIQTLRINSIFPHQLAKMAGDAGIRLITISTDCVFSGDKGNYSEGDFSDARDLYGKSKNLGEVQEGNCLTLRTSIIGRELFTGHSLVEWFLSNRGGRVRGFSGAIYSGFPTVEFGRILADLILRHPEIKGLYHLSSDPIDKFELLKLLNQYYRAGIEIEEYPDFKVDRSLNSEKFRQRTGFRPKSWDQMIRQMAEDETPYDLWKK